MKNLIAYFLTAVTFMTGFVTFASAQKPQALGLASAGSTGIVIGTPAAETGNAEGLFMVSGYRSRTHTYTMTAGEEIEIVLDGDGDTDLDMKVYSSNGTLIANKCGYSDYEVANITAFRSGTITIEVINRGSVYNQYHLSVY